MKRLTFPIFLIFSLAISGCYPNKRNLEIANSYVRCEDALVDVIIKDKSNRGLWKVQDSLFLFGAIKAIKKGSCGELFNYTKATETEFEIRECQLIDMVRPFTVNKNMNSDTLIVTRKGTSVLFKLPDQLCREPTWKDLYW